MAETVRYLTSLSIDECVERLKSEAIGFNFWQQLRGYPQGTIFLRLRGQSFVLRASLGRSLTNSFEPVFRGWFQVHPEGTLIEGHFGMHRGTGTFMVIWTVICVALLVLFTGAIVHNIVTDQASADFVPYLGVVIGVVLLVFGWGLRKVGIRLGQGQRAAIENFLRSKLQAYDKDL